MDHICLDGDWDVIFDDQNRGRLLRWQERTAFFSHHDIEAVSVPACLEEFRQDFEGVAWYGKVFELPADWQGSTVRLYFGAVNYRAEIWVNGEAAGHHEGGYTGFLLEAGDLLRPGEENFLAVRVITPLITRDVVIDGLGRDDMPHWRGAIAGGIWQSVYLLATEHVYLQDLFVTGDVHTGVAAVQAWLCNAGLRTEETELSWSVRASGEEQSLVAESERVVLRPGVTRLERRFAVPDFRLWDLDSPNLYELGLAATLPHAEGSPVSDAAQERFGFREFTVQGRHFHLNGNKIILKTVFNEAFYPHSLVFPRDMDLLRKEFQLIKEGNINMVRPWRKPQPPEVYDLADELGVLFVGALPVECMDNWPQITPYTRQRIENEVTEMVRRDRNHPSIVIWEMYNEILRDGLKRLRHSTSLKARENDPSRLIIDEAGGFAGLCSVYLPGSWEPMHINDVHDYPGAPLDRASYDSLLALGRTEEELQELGRVRPGVHTRSVIEPGLLTNISELGYGSIPDLEANLERYRREGNPLTPDYRIHERLYTSYLRVLAESGADAVFPDFHSFLEACQEIHYTGNRLMAEACRINPHVAGIGIHSLNDGDWIVGAGLIDNFREPKRAYYAVQEVFAPVFLAVRPEPDRLLAGEELHITLTAVNDGDPIDADLELEIQDAKGRSVFSGRSAAHLAGGIHDLQEFGADTADWQGAYRVTAELSRAGETAVQGHASIYVLDGPASELESVAAIDSTGQLRRHFARQGGRLHAFDRNTPASRLTLVNLSGWDGEPHPDLAALRAWVRDQGGTAVLLGSPPQSAFRTAEHLRRRRGDVPADLLLPWDMRFFNAKGLWMPCSHVVKPHPVYAGLPSGCLMGQEYREVVSRWSMSQPASDWICGTITYDWFAGEKHRQNYLGVSEAMHGADLTRLPHGAGEFIVCTHRIVENLGLDPVADRLLANLLSWLTSEPGPPSG